MSGTLFYLIGASGSGKDSLLAGCRQQLTPEQRCCVAHRYITRAPGIGGENHVHLSEQEFAMRERMGMFAMNWYSHGYHYGIGSEVNSWLDAGANVIINGSREYLSQAIEQYEELVPVLVEVDAELLRDRLTNRGRETAEEIERRLQRHQQLVDSLPDSVCRVNNSADLQQGIDSLLQLIQQHGWQNGIELDLPVMPKADTDSSEQNPVKSLAK